MSVESEPPPLVGAKIRPASARRVALGLFLFGLLDLVQSTASIIAAIRGGGNIHLNLPVTFVLLWVAAVLVWLDKRPIWPIVAYLSALTLGGLIGGIVGCCIGLPTKLLMTAVKAGTFTFWFTAGYLLLSAVFLGWLLIESEKTKALWWGPTPSPTSKWLQPLACLIYPIAPALLVAWSILALLQGSWTEPVVRRARAEHGTDCEYFTINYQFVSRNGRTEHSAVVLAYSETEMTSIPLHWSE